jgi:hypothetical protein
VPTAAFPARILSAVFVIVRPRTLFFAVVVGSLPQQQPVVAIRNIETLCPAVLAVSLAPQLPVLVIPNRRSVPLPSAENVLIPSHYFPHVWFVGERFLKETISLNEVVKLHFLSHSE